MIDAWARQQLNNGTAVSAVDHDPRLSRWYIRMHGDEKSVITIWMTLGERTLSYETQVMPAPEENIEACYEYLLRRNASMYGVRFSLGPEDAVYLVGQIPILALDQAELDRIVGASYAYTEECFPTAMAIGYAGKYKRVARRV